MASSTRHLLTAWSAVILLWVVVNIVIAVRRHRGSFLVETFIIILSA